MNLNLHIRSRGCERTRRSFHADTGMGFTGLALGAFLFKDAPSARENLVLVLFNHSDFVTVR